MPVTEIITIKKTYEFNPEVCRKEVNIEEEKDGPAMDVYTPANLSKAGLWTNEKGNGASAKGHRYSFRKAGTCDVTPIFFSPHFGIS